MPESTLERGSEVSRRDPEMKIREILRSGDLPFYRLESILGEEETVYLELILYFPEHLAAAEDLIGKIYPFGKISDKGVERILYPLKYEFSIRDINFILKMNTLFGQAFCSALSYLERGHVSVSSRNMDEMRNQVLKLEEIFKETALPSHGKNKSACRKSSSRKSASSLDYEEDLINVSEVIFYFQIHPSTLAKWTSLAEENGIFILTEPVNAAKGDELPDDLLSLMNVLRSLRIRDLLDLKDYLARNLENWQDLYEAFETARLMGLFTTQKVTPFEFAWALLKGRKALMENV